MSFAGLTPEQLATMPLAPNPTGGPSNFVNPESNAKPAIMVISIFLALTTLSVILRLLSRILIVRRTGLDDWCAILALLSSVAGVGCFFYLLDRNILGPHAWDVPLRLFISKAGTGTLLSIQIVGGLANFFAKMTILLFLKRIFPKGVSPWTARAVWFGIFANVVAYLILTVYLIAVCVPQVGNPRQGPNMCPGPLQIRLGQGSAAVNAFLDLYAFAVAVPSLWILQMPLKRKISVVGVLAIGLCACGVSLATLSKRVHNTDSRADPSRSQVSQLVFGLLEPLLAIITACLPAMPALWKEISMNGTASFRRLRPSKMTSSTSGWNVSKKSQTRREATSDDHSLKSLNVHDFRESNDAEQGISAIKVKNDYVVTTSTRDQLRLQPWDVGNGSSR